MGIRRRSGRDIRSEDVYRKGIPELRFNSINRVDWSHGHSSTLVRCVYWILGVVLLSGMIPRATGVEAGAEQFFENRIRPVLIENCYECHSG